MPIFSIVDLDSFHHDEKVEEIIDDLNLKWKVDEDFLPLLHEDDDTDSTASCTSSEASHEVGNQPGSPPLSLSLLSAQVPKFADVAQVFDPTVTTPAIISALNQLTLDVHELQVCVIDYYADLRSLSPLLSPAIAP